MNFYDIFQEKMNEKMEYEILPNEGLFLQVAADKVAIVNLENVIFRINFNTFTIEIFTEEWEDDSNVLENKRIIKALEVIKLIVKKYKLENIY
jgi:hypothetical protein